MNELTVDLKDNHSSEDQTMDDASTRISDNFERSESVEKENWIDGMSIGRFFSKCTQNKTENLEPDKNIYINLFKHSGLCGQG